MSPLTKIFVVLLVLVSLLQTAATVVFVNRIKPMQKEIDTATGLTAVAKNEAQTHLAAQRAVETQLQQASQAAKADHDSLATAIANLQDKINGQTAQLVTAGSEKQALANQNAALAQQAQWAIAAEKQLNEQLKALREKDDKLVLQQDWDSKRIAELTNLSDTLKSQSDNTSEQLTQAKDENEKLKAFIKSLGRDWKEPLGGGAVSSSSPINGKVTEKQNINGLTYVTVNSGSVDGVQVGTEFNILDSKGQFLGLVKIDHVDNNVSIGKFNGSADKVTQLQPGALAKTQIRE